MADRVVGKQHLDGLKMALDVAYGADNELDVILTLEDLIKEAEADLAKYQESCGDPYAHDCGKPNCPTSDSYVGSRT